MKRILLLLVSVFSLVSGYSALLAEYDRANNNVCVSAATWVAPDLSATTICRGSGISYSSGGDYNSNGWVTSNSIGANDYLEWSLTVIGGNTMDLNSMKIRYDRSGSGPTKMVIRTSLDSYTSDVFSDNSISSSGGNNTYTFSGFTAISGTVTFRLYAFNASSGSGTFDIEGYTGVNITDPGIQINGVVTSSCTPPTTQPTSSSETSINTSGATINWVGGNGVNTIVVVKETSAISGTPANSTTYSASTIFGGADEITTDEEVVYTGNGATVSVTGLTAGTTYHYSIFEFDGTTGSECYLTTSPQTGSFTTTALPSIAVTPSTLTGLDFIEGSGPSPAQSYSVSASNLFPASGNITVTGSPNFSVSNTLGGIYGGSFNIAYTGGTLAATDVFVQLNAGAGVGTHGPVNIVNSGGGATAVNVSVEGTVTPICITPTNQATSLVFSNITASSIDVAFTAAASPGADNYLVVQSTSSTLGTTPTDGTAYTVSNPFGSGIIVFNGSGTSFTDAGLSPSTQYYYFVFAYNDVACSGGPNYNTTVLTSSATTLTGPCLSDNFNSGYGNWTGGSGTYNNSGAGFTGNGIGFNDNNDDIITSSALTNPTSITFNASASSGSANYTITIQYSTSASGPWTDATSIEADGSNSGDITTSNNFFSLTLGLTGTYYLRILQSPRSGGSFYLDDVDVFCGAATPEIEIQGNSTEIVSGDNTPDLGDDTDFGATDVTGGTVVKTFKILNAGGADLTVSSVTSSNATIFAVAGTTSGTITAGNDIDFTVTFDPAALGVATATITVNSDDADEAVYTFDITGEGVNSNLSDIIESAGFTYTSDIDYTTYQDAGPITNTSNTVGVFRFEVRDGGGVADADALGTELTDITFNLGSTHAAYIRTAALFDGLAMRANAPIINVGAGTITFSGLSGSNFTAADNGSLTLTLRVSFLTNVVDKEQLQFTISSATANTSGSVFAAINAGAATSSVTGTRNELVVTATQLAFTVQPTNANVSGTMAPAVEVSGVDVNGNVDFDYTSSVSITSTGTLTGSPVSASASAGVASFSGLVHTVDGIGFTLTATDGVLTATTSTTFDITALPFVNGDYRTTGSGTWLSNNATPAIWERLVLGSWDPSNSPSFNTSNKVFIRDGHTITSGGSFGNNVNMYVLGGGVFNTNHSGTINELYIYDGGEVVANASLSISSSGSIEVYDNGTLTINFEYGNPVTSLFNGTENFHPNSNFVLRDWDAANDVLLTNNTSITTNTYGGYTAAFGNIISDFDLNLGASDDMTYLASGVTINLAHGDLIFRSNNGTVFPCNNVNKFRISTTGTVTSGIGGDFIVEDSFFYSGCFNSINFKTSGTLNFTIMGSMILDQAATNLGAGANPTTVLNIEGDLQILSGAFFNMQSTISASSTQTINLKGDYYSVNSGNFLATNLNVANNIFNFVGIGDGLTPATTQTIDAALTSGFEHQYISFFAKSGAYVQQINRDFELGRDAKLTIEDGATYDFGFDGTTPLNVMISGSQSGTSFASLEGSTLKITNPDGITTTSGTGVGIGNVQVPSSNRAFNQVATFHYIGKVNQVTGNAITSGSSGKQIIVELLDNTKELTLSNSTGFTNTTTISTTGGKLNILKGKVLETTTEYFTGTSGTLYMKPGTLYKVAKGNSTGAAALADVIPRMDGVSFPYNLEGGTIEFAGTGTDAFQTVRGGRTYPNLLFSGANTYLTDYKNLSSGVTIDSSLQITGTSVVDCITNSGTAATFTGDGALVMDGGRIRFLKLNTAQPELEGENRDYDLTGGTVEFYGTNTTGNQLLRANDGNSTSISYFNIDINADAASTQSGSDFYNVSPASSFEFTGDLNVNSPAIFRLDETESANGIGNISVNAGSTLVYGSPDGIKTSGTGTSDGNVRISGTRTFSTDASYGFVGNGDMVSGNGLPASCVNLYTRKTTASDEITLTNALEVKGDLNLETGVLVSTNSELLSLSDGATATNAGDNSYVSGPVRKIGNDAFVFPVGKSGNYQAVGISAPTLVTDHFTAEYFQADPHPTYDESNKDVTIDHISSCEYWILDRTNGTSDVSVTLTWDANSCGVTNLSDLLVTRWDGTTWKDHGNGSTTGALAAGTVTTSAAVTSFSPFTLASKTSANPLPVELLYFQAEKQNENVLVSWATVTEINNDFFTVERSNNGKDFEAIGEVFGAGNYAGKLDYNFLDKNALDGISYYRLKQTDFDGTYDYSDIVILNRKENSFKIAELFPNPVLNDLHFTFTNNTENIISVEILNMLGESIKSFKKVSLNESKEVVVGVKDLLPASYILKIKTQTKIISKLFIKK